MPDFEADLDGALDRVRAMLIEKNRRYGDSALRANPITSVSDAIKLRMFDKMRRLESGDPGEDEDVWLDLLGYGVLLSIAVEREEVDAQQLTRARPDHDLVRPRQFLQPL